MPLSKTMLSISENASGAKSWTGEAIVFCPNCKAVEVIQIDDSSLVKTRKFIQRGGLVYHDCGSRRSCCLYCLPLYH